MTSPSGVGYSESVWSTAKRLDGGWSLARRLPPPLNTEHAAFYAVVAGDGSLYFVSDRPGEHGWMSVSIQELWNKE